jgi:hypothetical protein
MWESVTARCAAASRARWCGASTTPCSARALRPPPLLTAAKVPSFLPKPATGMMLLRRLLLRCRCQWRSVPEAVIACVLGVLPSFGCSGIPLCMPSLSATLTARVRYPESSHSIPRPPVLVGIAAPGLSSDALLFTGQLISEHPVAAGSSLCMGVVGCLLSCLVHRFEMHVRLQQ